MDAPPAMQKVRDACKKRGSGGAKGLGRLVCIPIYLAHSMVLYLALLVGQITSVQRCKTTTSNKLNFCSTFSLDPNRQNQCSVDNNFSRRITPHLPPTKECSNSLMAVLIILPNGK